MSIEKLVDESVAEINKVTNEKYLKLGGIENPLILYSTNLSELEDTVNQLSKYRVLKVNVDNVVKAKREDGFEAIMALAETDRERFKIINKNNPSRESYILELYPEILTLESNKKLIDVGIDNCLSKIRFLESSLEFFKWNLENAEKLNELFRNYSAENEDNKSKEGGVFDE